MEEIEQFRRNFKARRELPDPKTVFKNYPDGIRWFLINELIVELGLSFFGLHKPFVRECDRINENFGNLIGEASKFEEAGNLEKAIKFYQEMIDLGFEGNFPYERLRIIYSKQKKYKDAINACRAFIEIANKLIEFGSRRADLGRKIEKFQAQIESLNKKLTKG